MAELDEIVRIGKNHFIRKERYAYDLYKYLPKSVTWEMLKDKVNGELNIEYLNDGSNITKLFYDLDGLMKEAIDGLMTVEQVADILQQNSTKHSFVFTNGSYLKEGCMKYSFHIIFQHYNIERATFEGKTILEGEKDEYCLLKKALHGLTNEMMDFFIKSIDVSVYKSHTCFRLPYGVMPGKTNAHQPQENTQPQQYFLKPANITPIYTFKNTAIQMITKIKVKEETKEETEERKNTMMDMLNMIKKERFQKYEEWFTLCCLMVSNKLSKNDFIKFSKESGYTNFDEYQCDKQWFSIELSEREEHPGFPTLHTWLEEDGVDWKEIFCKKKQNMISQLLKALHQNTIVPENDIVDIFYQNYKDSLYATPIGWLHHHHLRGWEIVTDDDITYPLANCIGKRFANFVRYGMKRQDKEDEKVFLLKQKNFMKFASHLCSYSFCIKIIKMARTVFKHDTILDEFDCKPNWFCFSDLRAIDMLSGEIIDIKKEDKILLTCGYPLPERIESDVEAAKQSILDVVGETNFESYCSIYAYQFKAGNPAQRIFIHTGSTGNGKSFIGNLLRSTMGKYGGILPIDQLTQNATGRDTANSALARMRGCRYAQLNEPEATSDENKLTLKVSRIKELTGENEVICRDLHQKAAKMRIDFTMNIICNEIPKLSKGEQAMERRLEIMTYPFQFVENPYASHHKQKNDQHYERSINDKKLHAGFLYMMFDCFKANKGQIIINEASRHDKNEYMKSNNPLGDFMDQYESSNTFIKQGELFETYRDWYNTRAFKDSEDFREIPFVGKKEFLKALRNLNIKIIDDSIHGNKIFVQKIVSSSF
jgi:hypothetical protein